MKFLIVSFCGGGSTFLAYEINKFVYFCLAWLFFSCPQISLQSKISNFTVLYFVLNKQNGILNIQAVIL